MRLALGVVMTGILLLVKPATRWVPNLRLVLIGSHTLSTMKYLFIFLIIIPLVSFGEAYKWTDGDGKIHFGDSPKEGDRAEKMEIKANVYEAVTYESVAPSQAPHQAARGPVTMYSTSWCGYCKKAIKYFKDNKVAYVERDVEKDPSARRAYDALGGKGIPIILVGQKRMNGFSVSGFEHIYKP